MKAARVPDVGGIAVLRANALGDLIVSLPALEALRATYPHARITLLGNAWHADFLDGRPGPIDEVVALPPIAGLTAPAGATGSDEAVRRCIERLRARRFDIALQLHGGGRYSNPFVRALGARVSAGFATKDSVALDRTLPYQPLQPQIAQQLEAVALVGGAPRTLSPRLRLRPRDRAEARRVHTGGGRPLVLLHPGARDPRRRWSAAHFARVGEHFAARGAEVLINGSGEDADCAAAVAAAMRGPAHVVDGHLSAGGLAALIAGARLVISNDTGPAHLARALEVPTVTVYWIGNFLTYGPLSAAGHRAALSWRLDCPVCGQRCIDAGCTHPASFVDDIAAETVIALAEALYDERERAAVGAR
ncbi:MAG: glycosyltransferase family 9 protein [Pseudomonadota bacterium]